MVPETGELVSSSNFNLRVALLRVVVVAAAADVDALALAVVDLPVRGAVSETLMGFWGVASIVAATAVAAALTSDLANLAGGNDCSLCSLNLRFDAGLCGGVMGFSVMTTTSCATSCTTDVAGDGDGDAVGDAVQGEAAATCSL